MFIAALFTVAKIWKQPKCPLTKDQIKKMWYLYTMEYYPAIKKNEIMPFAATYLEIIILHEVRRRMTYHVISLMCGIFKKLDNRTYLQNRNRLTDFENKLMVIKGERLWGGINYEFGINIYALL